MCNKICTKYELIINHKQKMLFWVAAEIAVYIKRTLCTTYKSKIFEFCLSASFVQKRNKNSIKLNLSHKNQRLLSSLLKTIDSDYCEKKT